ncbi:Vacuolar protein sorting-associated protein 8 [Recurvomyces mirabilis]|nr:Vacuolar protein sorting-associated protein 8 [Recurvomyces mirabilis]
MSSTARGDAEGGDNEDVQADETTRTEDERERRRKDEEDDTDDEDSSVIFGDMQGHERDDPMGEAGLDGQELSEQDVPQILREGVDGGVETPDYDLGPDLGPDPGPPTPLAASPLASPADSGSIPDDTPSLRGSLLSSPGRVTSPSHSPRRPIARTASSALQPFERRFETRLSASPLPSPRPSSPAFLTPHSRQFSALSSQDGSVSGDEAPQAPWEVIRWNKLRKITGQAFSESGKRSFGRPTCLAVSALIAVGTSKGLILGFDYHQNMKLIVGQGTKATECGSVTSIAISADYSTIAAGHANGSIFTWEISRPARPFLQVAPLAHAELSQRQHPDGHVSDCAVLHVGFLGTRHTALVSADAGGMAFSHLATRGLGPVTRTIKSTRLLGRYPAADINAERNRKPSSVLAFSPLPLGNVEQSTDNMGLTALLTPYLLVIVSTTPIAQTQHKSARPKEVTPHGTLSGCLAWFPAVKLKASNAEKDKENSDTKLVYCWSNVVSVLEVVVQENADPAKPPSLECHVRSRWRADEAIVAVQWLGRSVLGVLTVSQRLLIVEDNTLQVTDSIDLLHRHLYHQNLFADQLQAVVERVDSDDPSLHGVVADAFYMSFRAYKGRVFLLGFNDLTVGTLSNWADRLMALMENGDHIAAIRLATEYYSGGANNVTIGLPENDEARHEVVRERLLAMISASLSYSFSQHDEERSSRLQELAEVCFVACMGMQETDYLFGDCFDNFDDADESEIFVTTLEPYVLDGEVKVLPTEVVNSIVSHFVSENQAARLEELLCRLDPLSFDLDQITMLCRQHGLYDALIYVWTQGIGDFVTPLIDLLTLVKMLRQGDEDEDLSDDPFYESASKVFPYLAYALTGRRYPSGDLIDDEEAERVKAELYEYVFAGTPMPWPPGSRSTFRVADTADDEPAFPYLVLLLEFNTANFISMLNEAFEDSFLNVLDEDSAANGTILNGSSKRAGYKMTRQHIISIMLDVMRQQGFSPEQVIYLDMFIARSLPKYPGQLVLSGSLLTQVLQRLCEPPTDELREDCQLSIEYLLSAYKPPDVSRLVQSLQAARFFRVLKTVYRTERMFTDLLEVFFVDPEERQGVFRCIADCLLPSTAASQKQVSAIKSIVLDHAVDLADIDVVQSARTLCTSAPDLLEPTVNALQDSQQQFLFLRTLLEPALLQQTRASSAILPPPEAQKATFIEQYIQLMCLHDPTRVAGYIDTLPTSNLHLDHILPAMEEAGVIDAAVTLLSKDGRARDAMDRLVSHLQSLEQALTSLLTSAAEAPDERATYEAADDLTQAVEKYTKVGIWLCQGQSATAQRRPRPRTNLAWDVSEDDLDLDEYLWLNLVDAVVQVTKNAGAAANQYEDKRTSYGHDMLDVNQIVASLRGNVQQTFTALLSATASSSAKRSPYSNTNPRQDNLSFLRVLRAFLTRAAITALSLADLRAVLSGIFSAYAFEQGVLSLANELLGSDVFAEIKEVHDLRQRGWRPRSQVCEQCKRRAWGQGVGEAVWDAWVVKEGSREAEKARKLVERGGGEEARRLERGKAKAKTAVNIAERENGVEDEEGRKLTLVVFACRHVYHRVCIDPGFRDGAAGTECMLKCPLCSQHE